MADFEAQSRQTQTQASKSAAPSAAAQEAPQKATQASLDAAALKAAVAYNLSRGYNVREIKGFQRTLGVTEDGSMGPDTTRAVYAFQLSRPELGNDGKLGVTTRRAIQDMAGMTAGQGAGQRYAEAQVTAALGFNQSRQLSADTTKAVQEKVGVAQTGLLDRTTTLAIFTWQEQHGLGVDGKLGPRTMERMRVDVYAAGGPKPAGQASGQDAGQAPGGGLSASFGWAEFACKDGTAVPEEFRGNVRRLVTQLEVLRAAMGGRAIHINSGYRSQRHNQRVGGAPNSQHLFGTAADITVEGASPRTVAAKLEQLIRSGRIAEGGIGIYSTFVHYDVRGYRARW
jgi:hypothetical protein